MLEVINDQWASAQSNLPPKLSFKLTMDSVRFISIQMKVHEDLFYKPPTRRNLQSSLDNIQLSMPHQSEGYRSKVESRVESAIRLNETDENAKVNLPALGQHTSTEAKKQVIIQDAKDYYAAGADTVDKMSKTMSKLLNEDVRGECFIGFAKLLKEELHTFELKDRAAFDKKANQLS
mmetsp:Transcript_3420/g.2399  ORF Transcript_3420/g.2399 Transcript_3420/m.2399 type:complete len:177 (+) Transcript_3420:25-555(+)